MSSYEPPPLESPSPPFRGGSRQRGSKHTGRGPPIINPFGSPVVHASGSEDQSPTYATARRASEPRPVIAFIGGIAEDVGDDWVERILKACGEVISWKRARSADGSPYRFGFCEFKGVADAARAMRLLSDNGGTKSGGWVLPTSGKIHQPLQIRVDARVKSTVCEYQEASEPADRSESATDDSMLQSIKQIVRDLETIVIENARSDESKNNNAAPAKAADTPDEDSGQPVFSLEAEEAWEKEQAKKARHKRHIVAADEREKRVTAEQREREDRVKWSAMRELDGIEEMQRRQDAMATALAKWNDPREEQLGEHDYYRDRQRWWRHRKAERAREIELDEADRRQQERDDRANDKDAAGAAGRRDMIEALIKEIPSDPKALFDWPVKWQHVDAALIQSKIEPAVRKRLTEYLGSEGDDSSVDELTEYVATCIKERKRPQELINELEMVLVEEAPVFVARIWRFVVYESEAQARSVG